MIDRRVLADNGVHVTTSRQLAELIESERLRLEMSRAEVCRRSGAEHNQLNSFINGVHADASLRLAVGWARALECDLVMGGHVLTDVFQAAVLLEERREAVGVSIKSALTTNSRTWQRIREISLGRRPGRQVRIETLINMCELVDWELRMRRSPRLSDKQKRLLALGVDPSRVAAARTVY